jgi:hypothetical protein
MGANSSSSTVESKNPDLGIDVIMVIFEFCDIKTIHSLVLTCKELEQRISKSKRWERFFILDASNLKNQHKKAKGDLMQYVFNNASFFASNYYEMAINNMSMAATLCGAVNLKQIPHAIPYPSQRTYKWVLEKLLELKTRPFEYLILNTGHFFYILHVNKDGMEFEWYET